MVFVPRYDIVSVTMVHFPTRVVSVIRVKLVSDLPSVILVGFIVSSLQAEKPAINVTITQAIDILFILVVLKCPRSGHTKPNIKRIRFRFIAPKLNIKRTNKIVKIKN